MVAPKASGIRSGAVGVDQQAVPPLRNSDAAVPAGAPYSTRSKQSERGIVSRYGS